MNKFWLSLIVMQLMFGANFAYAELTKEDLREIGQVVREIVEPRFEAMDTKIDAIEGKLSAKIDAIEGKLSAKIDASKESLDARIIGVDAKLNLLSGFVLVLIALPQVLTFIREKKDFFEFKELVLKIPDIQKDILELKKSTHL